MVLTVSNKLMARSLRQLDAAANAKSANKIYSLAFLSAMHAIGALLSSRQGQIAGLRRPDSVWDLVPIAAPELTDQAAYFKERARQRCLADAGAADAVTRDEAEEMLMQATMFVETVTGML